MKPAHIAPCGMNCSLCLAYQREKNKCPGCRFINASHPVTRSRCRIKRCEHLKKSKSRFCFDCKSFPCARLKHLDQRYRTNNGMSMIENLNNIKTSGIRKFISTEKLKWTCPGCGDLLCVHRSFCLKCGNDKAAGSYAADSSEKKKEVMGEKPSELIRKISGKQIPKELIAVDVINNPAFIPELFGGLKHKKADVKYGCDKVLRIISEEYPALLFPHLDFFIDNLNNENNIFRWSAISIIANLSALDTSDRINRIIDKYLNPVEGPVFITAGNTIKGAAKIAVNKPELADKIAAILLRIPQAQYPTAQCKSIAAGFALEAFDQMFDLVADKASLINFALKYADNPRAAVKKKALKFLHKHTAELV